MVTAEVVELVGELHRHPAGGGVARLGPVEGGAEMGAAGAAGETGVWVHTVFIFGGSPCLAGAGLLVGSTER